MKNNKYCVIMAGGVGSRFWPLSKEERPKQFIDILGVGKTFIRQTYERFKGVVPDANFVIMTNYAYKSLVQEEIPEIKESQILCEPARRNTAPCIAYAAYHINAIDPDAVMIVTPSDHLITDNVGFIKIIEKTMAFASENDALMTIGVKPSRPETGYGYIQTPQVIDLEVISRVKSFTEKPNIELARVFLDSGEFLWNSGIFVWTCSSILKAIANHTSDTDSVFAEGKEFFGTDKENDFINKVYPTCKNISVDYGIIEKANNVYVCSADFGWSDIGTWGSLYDHTSHDNNGNSLSGGQVVCSNVKNSIIRLDSTKRAVIEGLDNHIVVCDDNLLLICSKDNEQEIKFYLDELNKK